MVVVRFFTIINFFIEDHKKNKSYVWWKFVDLALGLYFLIVFLGLISFPKVKITTGVKYRF